MTAQSKAKMTVDEFLAWAEGRPGRYELVAGEVVAMSPESVRHARTKFAVQTALAAAIARSGAGCEVLPDGMTVRIEEGTAYEPDALVRCGPPLPDESLEIPDPLIVVEVLSPSTARHDTGAKLAGCFQVPSLRHYLIVDPVRCVVVHHRRGRGVIETRIVGDGVIRLDPDLELGFDGMLGRAA